MCHNENTSGYNYNVYKFIRNNGGFDNWSMIMVERVECDNKIDLIKRERHYIDLLKPSLNKVVPLRTIKEYRISNIDKIRQCDKKRDKTEKRIKYKTMYGKKYHNDNADKLNEYSKQYYLDNIDKMNTLSKQYRIDNKAKLIQYRIDRKDIHNSKVQCECGSIIIGRSYNNHITLNKHIQYMANPLMAINV
jgi:acetolactate synthase regulatory subunit